MLWLEQCCIKKKKKTQGTGFFVDGGRMAQQTTGLHAIYTEQLAVIYAESISG